MKIDSGQYSVQPVIKALGDQIGCSKSGQIHSRFAKVVNFVCFELIVSIGDSSIEHGSRMIILDGVALNNIKHFAVNYESVVLNDKFILPYTPEQVFHSAFASGATTEDNLCKSLALLRNMYVRSTRPESLAYMLFDVHPQIERATFDQVLFLQLWEASQKLKQGHWLEGIAGIKGRGYGFTPSGDDFLVGLLMGLGFREQVEKKELSNIRQDIYALSLGKNLLANTYLHQALHGHYSASWLFLLQALTIQTEQIGAALQRILNLGETSGADTLAGFFTAWDIDF